MSNRKGGGLPPRRERRVMATSGNPLAEATSRGDYGWLRAIVLGLLALNLTAALIIAVLVMIGLWIVAALLTLIAVAAFVWLGLPSLKKILP